MEHTSFQERQQWYYDHDQVRVKAIRKKYEEYERTFWDVSKKVAEGDGSDALWQSSKGMYNFGVGPRFVYVSASVRVPK